MPGAGLVDWPLTYEELEPYYTKAEWELGVSGEPGPFDPPRSRPYPMPPLPVKSSGVLMEQGARALGLHPQPTQMAINSQTYNGRPAVSALWLLPVLHVRVPREVDVDGRRCCRSPKPRAAARSGRTATSRRSKSGRDGRATGVTYFDAKKRLQLQRAKAVVLCANGAETPRLLLNSASSRFPQGLANSSGVVGKHLMFNTYFGVNAQFDQPLNEFKSVQNTRMVLDFYETDPKRGFYGGGGIDARFGKYPITFALAACLQARRPGARTSRGRSRTSSRARWPLDAMARRCRSRPTASRSTRR